MLELPAGYAGRGGHRISKVTSGGVAVTTELASVTSGGDRVTSGDRPARRLALATFLAIGLAFAVVNALSELDERTRANRPVESWEPWVWELTSLAGFTVLAPLIFRLSQRFHPPRITWPGAVALHLLLSVPASLAHSAIMIGVRYGIYALMESSYRTGDLAGVLMYEYRKDLITYALLVALPHIARRLLDARARQEPPAAHRVEIRDGRRIRWVAPPDIDWAQAAGNYVELRGAFGTLLHRTTLALLESELAAHDFVRVHRSRIVRRAAIRSIETRPSGDFDLMLQNGETVGGSRRYRGNLG